MSIYCNIKGGTPATREVMKNRFPFFHLGKMLRDRQEKYLKTLLGKIIPGYLLYFDRDFLYDLFSLCDRDFLELDFFAP
jgi:hypothetical protein